MTDTRQPEVWLRGPLPGVGPFLQPVAHSLLQCREEVRRTLAGLTTEHLRQRPGDAASVAYHVRHAIGSLDRLLTYARGEGLSAEQLSALASEPGANESSATALEHIAAFDLAVHHAITQLGATGAGEAALLAPRGVGRAHLPSTVLGLLFHAAEHTQRHIGQAVTTSKIVHAGSAR